MKNINYLHADPSDADAIAQLHALSWQRHYTGIYPDDYLQNQVVHERLKVWRNRFNDQNDRQWVIKAMDEDRIIGFSCIYLDDDPFFGSLVDNLHVLQEYQGYGIGRRLLQLSAQLVLENRPGGKMYLLVLYKNLPAIAFYAKLGARMSDVFLHPNPAGHDDEVIRCEWTPEELLAGSE